MIQVKLPLPKATDSEEDWFCYLGAIRIASDSLRYASYGTGERGFNLGWEIHRLAMNVLGTGVWKRFPAIKKMVLYCLKNTVGYMEKLLRYDNIGSARRIKWNSAYILYMEARNEAEGRKVHPSRRPEDFKRKLEATVIDEIGKKQKMEEGDIEEAEEMTEEEDPQDEIHLDERSEKAGVEEEEEEEEEVELEREETREEWERVEGKEETLTRETLDSLFADSEDEDEYEGEDEEPGDELRGKHMTVRGHAGSGIQEEDDPQGGVHATERFLIKHRFETEERLYNYLIKYGQVLDILKTNGDDIDDGGELPSTVVVEYKKTNSKNPIMKRNPGRATKKMLIQRVTKWNRSIKWKLVCGNTYRNVSEEEAEAWTKWDICGEDDLLNSIRQDAAIEVRMKRADEVMDYYVKETFIYYFGRKETSCDVGKICLYNVTETQIMAVPGRSETRKRYHSQKCIDLKEVKSIELK